MTGAASNKQAMTRCNKHNRLWFSAIFGLFVLTGCAGFAEIEEVEQSQLQKEAILPDPAISMKSCPIHEKGYSTAHPIAAIVDEGGCGHPAPFAVQGLSGHYPVRFSTEARLNCVMLTQLHRFFAEQVQPMALAVYGQPVVSARIAASYVCRRRNGKSGGKLSEHGMANAIDISALTLADGTVLSIEKHWSGRQKNGGFLRQFNRKACQYFSTVIGPGGDKYHQDHFHLDHGRHGRNGTWRICQ